MSSAASFIRWFSDIGLGDVPRVGGKNPSLGELYRELTGAGVRVPNGFAITADGYRHFMQASGLAAKVAALLRGLRVADLADLAQRGLAIRHAITATDLPADLQDAIVSAYGRLGEGGAGRRGSAQQCDGRGPARRELCRPAGDLSHRTRSSRATAILRKPDGMLRAAHNSRALDHVS